MNIGLVRTGAGTAAVLIATHPLFAALLAHRFIAGDGLTLRRSVGLGVAFAGTAYLMLAPDAQVSSGLTSTTWSPLDSTLVLISGALLGARFVLTARLLKEREPALVITWQMLLSLPFFLTGARVYEPLETWKPITSPALLGLAYQGIIVAGLGFMTVAYLLKRFSASTTVSFGFVTPISGVALGALFLDEPFTLALGVALIAVAFGLVLVARREPP